MTGLRNVQDLETAAPLKTLCVIVVWLDGEYGPIKWKQQNSFDGRHSKLAFGNPDMELLAKSLEIWGREIDSAAAFRPALEEALAQDRPCLIPVDVDYAENCKLTKRLGEVERHL